MKRGTVNAPHQHQHSETPELELMRVIQQLQANLADSVNGVTLRGALPVPVGGPVGGANNGATLRPLANGAGRLVGWSIRESSLVGPVLVRFFDGPDANGRLIDAVPLASGAAAAPGSTSRVWYGPGGLSLTAGLFIQLTALDGVSAAVGAIEGDVFLGSVD